MIDTLMQALTAEFALDVVFHSAPPSSITAPSVIVTPGDPFMEPDTVGFVLERWDVWVAVSLNSPDRGPTQMRELGLRVSRAAHSVGATWRNSTGPRRLLDVQAQTLISINRIDFKYPRTLPIGE